MALHRLNPAYEPTFLKGSTTQSTLGIILTSSSGYTCTLSNLYRFGNVITGILYITATSDIAVNTLFTPFSSSMVSFSITSAHYNGITTTAGKAWVTSSHSLVAGTSYDSIITGILR